MPVSAWLRARLYIPRGWRDIYQLDGYRSLLRTAIQSCQPVITALVFLLLLKSPQNAIPLLTVLPEAMPGW